MAFLVKMALLSIEISTRDYTLVSVAATSQVIRRRKGREKKKNKKNMRLLYMQCMTCARNIQVCTPKRDEV